MLVLVTYDVETVTPMGRRRLSKVAKACVDYGTRVQNSVFECVLDPAQFATLKNRLKGLIDEEADSVRFYFMGNNWDKHIETQGKGTGTKANDTLLIV